MVCSYLYVEDVADAFDTILHKGKVGQIYNIGTQKERTVMDVARDIAAMFDLPDTDITHVRDRAFNDQRCGLAPAGAPCTCPHAIPCCPGTSRVMLQAWRVGNIPAAMGEVLVLKCIGRLPQRCFCISCDSLARL